ncbi:hypothetical protein G4B88_031393 [Cannabis sativa]|uniref:Uncharacterized protein n=1 Tax=Cannabis sativa TaxID=3483 RepID=A0A7J6F5N7_CANSA|nr:hypothetical protein G4B88_031393 [Cannabis sativa]
MDDIVTTHIFFDANFNDGSTNWIPNHIFTHPNFNWKDVDLGDLDEFQFLENQQQQDHSDDANEIIIQDDGIALDDIPKEFFEPNQQVEHDHETKKNSSSSSDLQTSITKELLEIKSSPIENEQQQDQSNEVSQIIIQDDGIGLDDLPEEFFKPNQEVEPAHETKTNSSSLTDLQRSIIKELLEIISSPIENKQQQDQSNEPDKIIIQDDGIGLDDLPEEFFKPNQEVKPNHEIKASSSSWSDTSTTNTNNYQGFYTSHLVPEMNKPYYLNMSSESGNWDQSNDYNQQPYQFCYTPQLVPKLTYPTDYYLDYSSESGWDQSNNKQDAQMVTTTHTFPILTHTPPPAIEYQQQETLSTRKRKSTSSNHGRWTIKEHMIFLQGMSKFGSGNWTEISTLLGGTRTPVQVASHAQKYFNKMEKEKQIAETTSENNKKKLNKSINDIRLREDGTFGVGSLIARFFGLMLAKNRRSEWSFGTARGRELDGERVGEKEKHSFLLNIWIKNVSSDRSSET